MHRDHYTQAVTVRREFGSHVSLGLGDKATLDLSRRRRRPPTRRSPQLRARRRRRVADGLAGGDAAATPPDPSTVGATPTPGSTATSSSTVGTRTLDAVSTPGHTQGHFVFADLAAGLLFAGDHVLPTITPSIGFEPAYADQPLGDFLGSLAKVARDARPAAAARARAGHRVHARARRRAGRAPRRAARALPRLGARRAGRRRTTSRATCPGPGTQRRLDDLDVFNAALASMETMAHLELLAARGPITRTDDDGVNVYAPR